MSVSVRFLYGGKFYLSKDEYPSLCYKKELVYWKKNVDPDLLSKIELEEFIKDGGVMKTVSELWFSKAGKKIHDGLQQILKDRDIVELCESVGKDNTVDVFVVQEGDGSPHDLVDFSKGRKIRSPSKIYSPTKIVNAEKVEVIPRGGITSSSAKNSNPKGAPPSSSKPQSRTSKYIPPSSSILQSRTSKYIPPSLSKPLSRPLLESLALCESSGGSDEDVNSGDSSTQEFSNDELLGSESSEELSSDDEPYDTNIFEDESDDDQEFEKNVDKDILDENVNKDQCTEDLFDVRVETDDYRSYSTGSGDEVIRVRYPEFNPLVDFKNKICFKPGMKFGSNDIFRKALRQYSIENGFDYYYLHNDGSKVSAYCLRKCQCGLKHGRKKCVCRENLCDFKACARRIGADGTFQLKTWFPKHNCGWQGTNTKMTSNWLAEKYLEHYRDDPQWRIKVFVRTVKREHGIDISYQQAWRARMRAILMTQGYSPEQYAKVWDYAATLLKWNPRSSAYVMPEDSPERPLKFQRFYVCLKAQKEGFLAGCRLVIGLDGCHLKGAYTGQVLTAVAKDGNENIFPLAFAVVELETKASWCWFLELLIQDVGNKALTFMSDRQKGLIEALAEIAPMCDTRVCVRHMHNNFKKQWPGKSFKDVVWAAAKASTIADFEAAMKIIRDMNVDAHDYLLAQDPSTWSLHAFRHYSKSDMLLNNACESFNSCLLPAREMPILSMCEWIRRKLMNMFISKRAKMSNHVGLLTPEATTKLNHTRIESEFRCKCHGGIEIYEVDCAGKTYVVDLQRRSCGCNMWELTGLPCCHAVCCILKRRLDIEQFVSPYFHKETYLRAYGLSVNPMPGQDQWEKTAQPPLDPPKLVVQPGRPRKKRRKEPGEGSSKSTRIRFGRNKCGNCGVEGHTRKTCKNPPKPPEPPKVPVRGGRTPKESTLPTQIKKRKYTKRKVRSINTVEVEANVQVANEQDNDMQAMIESAMQSEVQVIPTQGSQTTMPIPPSQMEYYHSSATTSKNTTKQAISKYKASKTAAKTTNLRRTTRKHN